MEPRPSRIPKPRKRQRVSERSDYPSSSPSTLRTGFPSTSRTWEDILSSFRTARGIVWPEPETDWSQHPTTDQVNQGVEGGSDDHVIPQSGELGPLPLPLQIPAPLHTNDQPSSTEDQPSPAYQIPSPDHHPASQSDSPVTVVSAQSEFSIETTAVSEESPGPLGLAAAMAPRDREPTFSGMPGERVDIYVKKCKYAYAGLGLTPEELEEARGMCLYDGLSGTALDFVRSLPKATQTDFTLLSKELEERFPWKEPEEDHDAVLSSLMLLSQGTKSIETYSEEALKLKSKVPKEFQALLAQKWARGLKDQALSHTIIVAQKDWKERKDPVTIERTIDYTKTAMGHTETSFETPKTEMEDLAVSMKGLTSALEGILSAAGLQLDLKRTNGRALPSTAQGTPQILQRPQGQNRMREWNDDQMICFRCGTTGHRASVCKNPALKEEEQAKLRNAASKRSFFPNGVPRDPPLSQTLGKDRITEITSSNDSASTQKPVTVHYVDAHDPALQNWEHENAHNVINQAVVTGQAEEVSRMAYTVDTSANIRTFLANVYQATGSKRTHEEAGSTNEEIRAERRARHSFKDTPKRRPQEKDFPNNAASDPGPGKASTSFQIPTMPPPGSAPRPTATKEERRIQGLKGEPYNIKEDLNDIRADISLLQLANASPRLRAELAKMLRLIPKKKKAATSKKGKEPAKETAMLTVIPTPAGIERFVASAITEPLPDRTLHDDMFQPKMPHAADLFYVTTTVLATCVDQQLRITALPFTLIDGGSTSNLIPMYAVEKLRACTVPVEGGTMEVADGRHVKLNSLVWVQVSVAGSTSVVAALVVPGRPKYQLLLGRHWMQYVAIHGDYEEGSYSIRTNDGFRKELSRTTVNHHGVAEIDTNHRWTEQQTWVQVDTADADWEIISEFTSAETEDSMDEKELDKQLRSIIREATVEDYNADTESSSEN